MALPGTLEGSHCPVYCHYEIIRPRHNAVQHPAERVNRACGISNRCPKYQRLKPFSWPSVLEGPRAPNLRGLSVKPGALQNKRHGSAGAHDVSSKGVNINPNVKQKPVNDDDDATSKPTSSRAHSHSHDQGHSHPHVHPHSHSHGHSQDHPHDHDHDHDHDHHHTRSHSHGHSHSHEHSQSHAHSHAHEHAHDNSHGHSHGHPHPHDHGHPHAPAGPDLRTNERHLWSHAGGADGQVLLLPPSVTPRNPPLSQGAARGKVLFIDAHVAGVAGDMLAAALWDLGVPAGVLQCGLQALPIGGYSVRLGLGVRSAITAARFVVKETSPQPFRDWTTIKQLLASAALPDGAKAIALDAFGRLAASEASVHGVPIDQVHFHEVGAVDSIVDIVATALAMDYLAPSQVVVSPLPMGRGIILGAAHGPLPAPPPATLGVLCGTGIPTYDPGCDGELVTPTGACLVAALATGISRWPSMAPLRVAYGAGSRDPQDRPNLVRIVMGDPVQ